MKVVMKLLSLAVAVNLAGLSMPTAFADSFSNPDLCECIVRTKNLNTGIETEHPYSKIRYQAFSPETIIEGNSVKFLLQNGELEGNKGVKSKKVSLILMIAKLLQDGQRKLTHMTAATANQSDTLESEGLKTSVHDAELNIRYSVECIEN